MKTSIKLSNLRRDLVNTYLIDTAFQQKFIELFDEIKKLETTKPVNVDLADVMFSVCNDYVDGINMDCAKCGEPKYKHLT
jgi:DNA transposition AAA+ family ATPase